ncbi:MAG TPA: hypothetical protein VMS08_01130 [Candidatus Saccharimonadia bacterium]|nr:hypothetical protein [Candidatus Saccharimonadia bacterium]
MPFQFPLTNDAISDLTKGEALGGAIMAQHIRTMSAKQAEVAEARRVREAKETETAAREAEAVRRNRN